MYQGFTATVPVGALGLLTDRPPSEIPPNALIKANNITLERGIVEKATGGLRYNASALSGAVVGLFDWWPTTVKQRLIVATADGKIYRDIGDRTFNGGTAIKEGLGVLNPNCLFVEGGQETAILPKKLFFFSSGLNQVQVLDGDGTTFRDIGNPATDWTSPNFPKFGLVHRSRLWAFSGKRAYASSTSSHENFTSSFLTQPIYPGEGGDVIGAYVFKGRLFAFKDGGFVYYLEDSAADSSTWYWKRLTGNFGLAGVHGIMEGLNDMLVANTTGSITSHQATDSLGDIESSDIFRITEIESYIRANLNQSGLTTIHGLYYEAKKLGFFTYKSTYKPFTDMLICLDFNKENVRITLWPKGTPQCLGLRRDVNKVKRPIYGDKDGYVILMDREDREEGGSAYTGEFQTPHLDMSHLDPGLKTLQKHFEYVDVEFVEEGNWNITCDVYIDGRYTQTVTFAQQILGDYLDQFDLDDDRLAQRTTQQTSQRIYGTGRRISLHFKNSGQNQNFQIASYSIKFRSAGHEPTKT